MEYIKDTMIEFTIYGDIVRGIIVKDEGSRVRIKTTHDYVKVNINKEQLLDKSHSHCIVT